MTITTIRRIAALACLVAAAALSPLATDTARAHDTKAGPLTIDHPWARPTIPNRPTAAYMTIMNDGETADRLIAATSPAFGRIELHETSEKDGIMRMEEVEGIVAPAGGEAVLAPRGLHIMLFDATAQLTEGDRFPMVLSFEQAGDLLVEVVVQKGPGKAMDHGSHGHGAHESHGTTN